MFHSKTENFLLYEFISKMRFEGMSMWKCGSNLGMFFLKKKNRPGGRLFRTKELVAFLIEDAF